MLCLRHYGPALLRFWFQTDLGRENSPREDLFLPLLWVGHALRPIFMLWLVKIWPVSSCGKFMQHLETCLLWQLKLRVLCQLVMFLTVFFHCMYKMKYSCYQGLSVIRDWFVYWVFGWLIAKIAASEASPAAAWGGEMAVEPGDMPLMPPRRRSNSIPWCIFPEASRNIVVMADSIVK